MGKVWPGATVFPDFTLQHVREAWGRFHRPLIEAGVAGFWNDMNDPVFRAGEVYDPLAEDVLHHGVPHRQVRNLYANGMAEATVAGLESLRPGERPFVLSRSGFLGIQRHAAVWTGDNHSSWEHLRQNLHMVLNLGLSGVPISRRRRRGLRARDPAIRRRQAVAPVGGTLRALDGTRRADAVLPRPLHAVRAAQEPWSFGRRALELSRRVLRRRYRAAAAAVSAGPGGAQRRPADRPAPVHAFRRASGKGAGQFLLGDSRARGPVLHKGATSGRSGSRRATGSTGTGEATAAGEPSIAQAPLGTTPLFVRAGSALFLAEPGRNAEETLRAPLALEVTAPLPGTVGRGSLFLDDGESAAGGRFLLDTTVENVEGLLRIRFTRVTDTFVPAQRDLELRVPPSCRWVIVDGERRELQSRTLGEEGRSAVVRVARVPLAARDMVVGRSRRPASDGN